MFARFKYWRARRLAFIALCVSLEETPEQWNFGYRTATREGIRLEEYTNQYILFDKRIRMDVKNESWDVSYRWGKRLRKAIQRGRALVVLKAAVAAIRPANTPLQIADASR